MGNDLRRILRALEEQGFTVTRSKSGHWLIDNAHGERIAVLAGTASDWRALRNGLARLKRHGFRWPPTR